ncbi:TMEM165/GDT1 family protein [Mesobacillus jeotgali]|uniref:TMEM165/GDT1 family protein n=1 Tax=Mesobacillus jeotgali TaxID=129985 RepID=UPI0009A565C5|nr:TMEM165/GDT1 family protein [Mesobacillus jeotgali]
MLKKAKKDSALDIDNQAMLDDEEQQPEVIYHEHSHRKPVFFGTILAVVLAIGLSTILGSYSSEGSAEEVVANRISKSTVAGETPFTDETNAGIAARDFEVTVGDSGGDAKMLIWDFNSEDSDEVQILVNGQPLKEKLILANNPAAISIPVPSTVTIKGLKDNGGGISYAVKFPNDKITYYNVVSVNAGNTYTVKPL